MLIIQGKVLKRLTYVRNQAIMRSLAVIAVQDKNQNTTN